MNNIKVSYKLLILVIIAVIGMSVVGIEGALSIKEANYQLTQLYKNEMRSVELLGQACEKMRTIQVRSMQVIADPARLAELRKSQLKDIDEMDMILSEYTKLAKNGDNEAQAIEMVAGWEKFKKSMPAVISAVQSGGSDAGIAEYNKGAKDDTVKLRDALTALSTETINDAAKTNEINISEGEKSIIMMAVVTIICIVLMLAFSYLLVMAIKKPLDNMMAGCDKLAQGDFSVNSELVERKDEFGDVERALHNMTVEVSKLLKNFSKATEQIAAASEQLNSSSMESANAATSVAQSVGDAAGIVASQQSAVEAGSQHVTAITESVDHISQEASNIASDANKTAERAKSGSSVVDESVSQIRHVEETVHTTAKLVDKLGERSQEIGAIVDTISNLAGQTNLLALNAAIEAARAGEAGRGFTVVAEEVRKLAEQSASAAQQISALIDSIQTDTAKAVKSMSAGREAVAKGTESVEGLHAVFAEINQLIEAVSGKINNMANSIQLVAGQAEDISNQMQEIDNGAVKVSDNMQSVSAATQEQSASAEEIAAASESLAKQAEEVQENLQKFKF